MYSWLSESLAAGAQIVTANLRLARMLHQHHADRQIESGHSAWLRPDILDWPAWLTALAETAPASADRPLRISSLQSRALWEQCLAAELDTDSINVSRLVPLAREARRRISEWRVPLAQVGESAISEDQRRFAAALNVYLRRLEREQWADEAGFAEWVLSGLEAGLLASPRAIVFAGFISPTPLVRAFADTIQGESARVQFVSASGKPAASFVEYIDEDAELRAAGGWARDRLTADPTLRIAIVASGLESSASRFAHRLREGFCPGWQLGPGGRDELVNVSYGRRLSDYPAIAQAFMLLRWLVAPLRARDVATLLLSDLSGEQSDDSRAQAELALRDMPDRNWSIELFARVFGRDGEDTCLQDWIERLNNALERIKGSGPGPLAYGEAFDEALRLTGWPGSAPLDSTDFQVVNRWRELLNDFARLALVTPRMTPGVALSRLSSIASDVVFQPEQRGAVLQLLGPLEAAGAEFDATWICGMTKRRWPAAARPSPLLSATLQREYGLPDSSPADTAAYAGLTLSSLTAGSKEIVFSMARFDGDAEQSRSSLLPTGLPVTEPADPGWFAQRFTGAPSDLIEERAPPVRNGDRVYGGAGTIDRQANSPFDAFAIGRLGLNDIPRISAALSPRLRGNLVHSALQKIYESRPRQLEIRSWADEERQRRIAEAVQHAVAREFVAADEVLRQVLRFEERRLWRLLEAVLDYDSARAEFAVESVEESRIFTHGALTLSLRADRIDRLPDQTCFVLDYKTGKEKRFLRSGEPTSLQLVLYSLVSDIEVGALGLFNVDSRTVGISAAGRSDKDVDDRLSHWQALAFAHIERLTGGDVRINAFQSDRDSRRTGLLSRVAELRHDG